MQTNALKFTPFGGSVQIICTKIKEVIQLEHEEHHAYFQRCENGMIQISVKDNGQGVEKKDMSKLFDLFGYQGQNSDRNCNGAGLGLHNSKMISKQLGGDIAVKSNWGEGTKFTLVFATERMLDKVYKLERIKNPEVVHYTKIEKKFVIKINNK